jgi:tellurite resistance protein TerC
MDIYLSSPLFFGLQNTAKIPASVLFLGYSRAIVFRGLMIFGVMLINKFFTTLFGFFLVFTAMKMLFTTGDQKFEPKNPFFFKVLKDNADFKSYRP